MYDVVGDVHGQARELETLLAKLGYECEDGCYSHQNRKVIFLGDFIDRGLQQREVINIVRPMIDTGTAYTVMGNHEFNAIAYYTPNGRGSYLRQRNSKNTLQHQAFLNTYQDDPDGWKDVIDWFKTFPLWLDFHDIRVIHVQCSELQIHHTSSRRKVRESFGRCSWREGVCLNLYARWVNAISDTRSTMSTRNSTKR